MPTFFNKWFLDIEIANSKWHTNQVNFFLEMKSRLHFITPNMVWHSLKTHSATYHGAFKFQPWHISFQVFFWLSMWILFNCIRYLEGDSSVSPECCDPLRIARIFRAKIDLRVATNPHPGVCSKVRIGYREYCINSHENGNLCFTTFRLSQPTKSEFPKKRLDWRRRKLMLRLILTRLLTKISLRCLKLI